MVINKSKSYILPLLDDYVSIKHVGLVRNTYLFLEGKEDKFIIVQYTKDEALDDYILELSSNEYVNNIIDLGDYIYVIFNKPEQLSQDYEKFLKGKFSEISGKDKIVKFLVTNYGSQAFKAIQRIKQVLYKDKALKEEIEYNLDIPLPPDSELSSIPDKITETLIL